jgi:hypothetical protein
MVVLPEPLRPTMPTIWPGSTANEISLTAGVGDPGHAVELDVAADGRGELAARRFWRGLHQLGEELQRQHRALIILHQGGGVDQRLHQPQSQHVEGDEHADGHLVAQHEQCAQCSDPDAHAALEAGDDAAGARSSVVERQALARRLFGMTPPAQQRARLERQSLDRRNAVEDLEEEGLAAALDFVDLAEPLAERCATSPPAR